MAKLEHCLRKMLTISTTHVLWREEFGEGVWIEYYHDKFYRFIGGICVELYYITCDDLKYNKWRVIEKNLCYRCSNRGFLARYRWSDGMLCSEGQITCVPTKQDREKYYCLPCALTTLHEWIRYRYTDAVTHQQRIIKQASEKPPIKPI